jgi:hypothetical protein
MLEIFNKRGVMLDEPICMSLQSGMMGDLRFNIFRNSTEDGVHIIHTWQGLETELSMHNGQVYFIKSLSPKSTSMNSFIRQTEQETLRLLPRLGYRLQKEREWDYIYVRDI